MTENIQGPQLPLCPVKYLVPVSVEEGKLSAAIIPEIASLLFLRRKFTFSQQIGQQDSVARFL